MSKTPELDGAPIEEPPLENIQKCRWERSWPTIACGAGLFSDGYLNGVCALIFYRGMDGVKSCPALTILQVIGAVNTMLGEIYPDTYSKSRLARKFRQLHSPVRFLDNSCLDIWQITGRASGP